PRCGRGGLLVDLATLLTLSPRPKELARHAWTWRHFPRGQDPFRGHVRTGQVGGISEKVRAAGSHAHVGPSVPAPLDGHWSEGVRMFRTEFGLLLRRELQHRAAFLEP